MKVRSLLAFLVLLIAASAAAAQAKRAEPAPNFRNITIITEPRAVIWLDGVRFGRTNESGKLEIKTVSTGAHKLRIRADGFRESNTNITAVQRGEIRVPLTKTTDAAELAFQEAERLSLLDREQAVEAYRRAIKARPNFPDAFLAIARQLSEMGDLEDALEAVASARRLRPGFAEAAAVEGRIYREMGEEAKAIAAFKRSITEGRGFQPEAHTGLGLIYKDKAEAHGSVGEFVEESAAYAEASKNLRIAIKQLSGAPEASVIYQLLGLVYERQNRNKEAIAVYEEFLRLYPDSGDATTVRSFITQLKKLDDEQ
ncbi:MAG: tetratricopeptide repeat protein [Acidobacteriota bacterium]|nr:MAG: tetratricopeptide repeat protein [Acidobacteriota bacterium]